jgi:hypothetical protein
VISTQTSYANMSEQSHDRLISFGAVAILLAVALMILDAATGVDLNVSILYPVPLIVAAMAPSFRLVGFLSVTLSTTVFLIYATQAAATDIGLFGPLFVNRILSFISVLGTAILLSISLLAKSPTRTHA